MPHKPLPRLISILLIAAMLSVLPAPASAAAKAAAPQAPGKVTVTSVTADAYNKVTVRWKRAAGATHYYIFYKKADAAQWVQVGMTDASRVSYTHVSSQELPIAVGCKYTYTVLAYNKLTGERGEYDQKGLAVMTRPDAVPLGSAVWNEEQTQVTLSWGVAGGASAYLVYRKTGSADKWTRLAELAAGTTKYVDSSPAKEEKNLYAVVAYDPDTKVSGKYDGKGIEPLTQEQARTADLAKILSATATASMTDQIILVVDHNLSLWEKSADGNWSRRLSVYCGYGSNGLSADRSEGDRTTPIGSFPILHGFGSAENPGSTMLYKKITSNSYWSGEQSTYNQWVESPRRISGEHLIDYYQYKYAMAIGFNRNPTIYKKGSAIFLHCKSYNHWSTAGCVSVEEQVMKQLLQLCRNGTYIIIVRNQEDIAAY